MADTKCKTCRRAGEKLFLKEEKCFSPKCTMVKKPYPPGKRAKRMGSSKSEYGLQLQEKQSLKFLYGLREKQFEKYIKQAMKKGGEKISEGLVGALESRLDNVVFKLGLAQSRSSAKQIISHGHIQVNGRKITIPSFQGKKGNKISIKPQNLSKGIFSNLDLQLKKYNPPSWLKLDKAKKEGEILKKPGVEDAGLTSDLNRIIAFYSR